MPDIQFTGPAGRLEGRFFQQEDKFAPIAVVLHPHPLHGGSMNNKVTYRTYETFVRNGFSVLRFNFRGVQNSEGEYDNGVGELADACAALDWLHSQNPHAEAIWLAGFSFGGWITMQMLMRRPDVARFIAISPPMGNYDFSFLSPCPTSGMVVVGTADDISPPEDIERVLKQTMRQKGVKLSFAKVPDADHFFTNHQDALGTLVHNYIQRERSPEGQVG